MKCLLLLVACSPFPLSQTESPDFDRHIAPLFADRCLDCHSGPRPKGGLDLASEKALQRGGKNGSALRPGDPGKSLIWDRVDADEMPPKHPLTQEEKKLLRDWIQGGARWGKTDIDPLRYTTLKRAGYDWWSLKPVNRPPLPSVRDKAWPLNPIDHFILARLESAGLAPSRDADRRTLLRRLSFDLIGLPPTPEEVDAFIADRRPDAYERQVERLLASPHYGERWARHWLDVVRFGESSGFERNDPRPNAWHYRDWVIAALNADMPYDEFCRLQLAGDVLRPGEPEAAKATGYLVAGIHNTVVPMQKKARDMAEQDELEDLIANVGQTFVGMTINCARCHDHKFDPVSQKDYYRIASVLAGVQHGEREVAAAANAKRQAEAKAELTTIEKGVVDLEQPYRDKILSARKSGLTTRKAPTPIAAWDFRAGLKDQLGDRHASLVGDARLTPDGLILDGKKGFARTAPLQRELKQKTLEAWVRLDNLEQRGGGVFTIQSIDGNTFDAIVFAEKDARQWLAGSNFFQRTQSFVGPPEADAATRVIHLAITYAEDGVITAYRDGRPYGKPYRSASLLAFPPEKTVAAFGIRHEPPGGNKMLAGVIAKARLYDWALTADEVATSAERDDFVSEAELSAALPADAATRRSKLLADRTRLTKEIASLDATRFKIYAAISKQPEVTRLLIRGQVTDPTDVITPGAVAALGSADFSLAADAPEGERRKKLAAWITSPDNPRFARVMVNRLWHHHFGVGIVDTPSDFGFGGGRPSHPELLDWLAAEFKERGYRLKELHRLIVTARVYRQSSAPRKEALAKDADNRLLWRKRPMRLEGEAVRDAMLQTAGLLNREIGGKGFSDYKEASGAGTVYYEPFDPVGPASHRRSIYRFQPRGANPGLLDVFDCPDPAATAPRRNTTTTPLQALALWNSAFGLRMAQSLANRLEKEAPGDRDRQVERAYLLTCQRAPTPAERKMALRLVEEHAMRALCRSLINANEFMYVD